MISLIHIELTLCLVAGWINSSKRLRKGCGRVLKYPYLAMEKVNVMVYSLSISNSVVKLAETESVNKVMCDLRLSEP
jgi:hypothetical protein